MAALDMPAISFLGLCWGPLCGFWGCRWWPKQTHDHVEGYTQPM